jgi:hypothetical protein
LSSTKLAQPPEVPLDKAIATPDTVQAINFHPGDDSLLVAALWDNSVRAYKVQPDLTPQELFQKVDSHPCLSAVWSKVSQSSCLEKTAPEDLANGLHDIAVCSRMGRNFSMEASTDASNC